MADMQSSFRVKVTAEGAQSAQQAIDKLNQATGQSAQKQQAALSGVIKGMARMGRLADDLIGKFQRLESSMRSMSRHARSAAGSGRVADGTRAFGGTVPTTTGDDRIDEVHARHRDAVNRSTAAPAARAAAAAASPVARSMPMTMPQASAAPSPYAPAPQRGLGPFAHGLLQAMLPGPLGFIQRGPGAMMQGAGLVAGNVASSLMTMPFTGSGGLGGAAGALGSLVSAPLSRYMGNAGNAMGFERQQMQMAPLLGGYGSFDANPAETSGMRAEAARYAQGQAAAANRRGAGTGLFAGMFGSQGPGGVSAGDFAGEGMRRARQRALMAGVGAAGEMGSRLMGADLGASQQFASQIAASGGGTAQMAGSGFIGAAMAARTTMGISPETAGAFALGGRTNAVRGTGAGDPTKMLMDVIQQTRDLGLQGSDAQQYLQQMAEGIRQFQQSGMPLEKDSIYGITRGLTGFGGMGAMQAQRAAFNLQGRGQDLYDSGPQSSMDLAILQAGGFKGGIDSLLGTERGFAKDSGKYASAFMDVLPSLTRSDSKETRISSIYKALKKAGISSDLGVAEAVEQQMQQNGGKLPAQFAKSLAAGRSGGGNLTAADLQTEAAGMVPSSAKAAAALSNQGVAMGAGASAVSLELDAAANDAAQVMSRFSGLLLKMARAAHGASDYVNGGDSMAPAIQPVN